MPRLTNSFSALALLVSTLGLGLGCGAEPPPPADSANTSAANDSAKTGPKDDTKAADVKGPERKPFENPGGMWVPSQLAEHEAKLKGAGLELDPKALTDPMQPPLAAVVSLGGCSASFVSPDGLIVTNHHCVTGILQFNATPKQNVANDGYLAKTRADEKWAGPTNRIFVTRSFKDVTKDVREGLDKLPNDRARNDQIEAREKTLVGACEKDRPEVRCSLKAYFGGAQYLLVEQLEIRDVRLVYAPPEGVGNFGGEIDNWRWPRHGGDFAFLRAYVGKDQKPADHAETNVPYKPAHYLRLAQKPLAPNDFVMVAGYPGTTNRLRTSFEIKEALEWGYPRRIAAFEEGVKVLESVSKQKEEIAIKANPFLRGISNALTKIKGLAEGLGKGGVAAERAKKDADLAAWIGGDAERKAAYGDVIAKIEALVAERKKTREEDMALGDMMMSASLFQAASTIVRMAEERPKADAERDPEFQERTWKRIEQKMTRLSASYDRAIDQAMLKLALERVAKLPEKERPAFVATIAGKKLDAAAIEKAVKGLYEGTKLEDEKARLELLKTAKLDDLKKSKDPLIKLAVALRPAYKASEDRGKSFDGAMALLRPKYFEALQKMLGQQIAPDANGTLRVTYGSVRGYRPTKDAPVYTPFTTTSEMVKKHTGKEPFEAPSKLLAAANAKKWGTYADAALGEVPVDFLSDLDITGGNSGSPTLNGKGELVGLAFDGNYEAMASDVIFLPEITRTIHVDLRYVLWVMDVEGADNVLQELGVKPSID
ncbi:S46 family peptidase [Polyangium mundeleinium]|uniref:Dipeptidyl-peptidase n=1 Tax=Polyangium mundeleinium TaxID=2995306 RepID=A0ABT5F0L6_9BACT|nr:S46 family peptidase [Polyangium mundeleinium]MDC0747613.1 S46 family peptidase [Polyangium mundeleinium]